MTPGAVIAIAAWGLGILWLCRQILRDALETRETAHLLKARLDQDGLRPYELSDRRTAEVIPFPPAPTRNGDGGKTA